MNRKRQKNLFIVMLFVVAAIIESLMWIVANHYIIKYPEYEPPIIASVVCLTIANIVGSIFMFGVRFPDDFN